MRVLCVLVALLVSATLIVADPLNCKSNTVVGEPIDTLARGKGSTIGYATRGLNKRHQWKDVYANEESTMSPHMKSVISGRGKTKKESKGKSDDDKGKNSSSRSDNDSKGKNDNRNKGMGKRARPVLDEEDSDDGDDRKTNSTKVKKSKQKKSDSSSEEKQKDKDKLSLPTTTPTAYPTLISGSPVAVATPMAPAPAASTGMRPVFEEPSATPVNDTVVTTGSPAAAPVVTASPVLTAAPVSAAVPSNASSTNVQVPVAAPVVVNQTQAQAPVAGSLSATASPTVAPQVNIVTASDEAVATRTNSDLHVGTVQTRPLYLRVEGDFDPVVEEGDFFAIVEETFSPYSRAYLSYILNEFEIAVLFLNALTQVTAKADGTSLATSWCEVNVTFLIESENEEDIAGFTVDRASQFVKRFFMDSHKTRLLNLFAETGVSVTDLEVMDALPNDVGAILTGTESARSETGATDAPPPTAEEGEEDDLSRSSFAVAIASGGVIFLALGAMALATRHRDRVSNIHGRSMLISGEVDGDLSNAKALAFVSGDRQGDIKPAALHVRNRRERDRRRRRAMSSNNTVSTYFTTETALTTTSKGDSTQGREAVPASSAGVAASVTSATADDNDDDVSVPPIPTRSRLADLAASSALTCLDGDESVGALNEAYPEFELYQSNASPPPSPVWSIDNYSNTSPYSVEEDYVAERRRWHDEANELDLIALPDTSSVYSMTQHSRSDRSDRSDPSDTEERSTRTRMDEV